MKKFVKIVSVVVVAALAAGLLGACNPSHVHRWGVWQRDAQEHWRTCVYSGCKAEQRSRHTDKVNGESVTAEYICDDCVNFRILALGYLDGGDAAHADFAREANAWFPEQGKRYGFYYDFTEDFGALNDENLEKYALVMFLNNRPYDRAQQAAFEKYMNNGGAWIGYHVCAYNDSASEKWDWYFNDFLGTGKFRTNTWNPTRETLKVETQEHFATAGLPNKINSAYNEWYNWEKDLRLNDDITVLLSLDPSTYPVGDRPGEIWTDYSDAEYCPVTWTNNNYKMIYMNMGHNLQSYNDYEKQSETFESAEQNRFIINSALGLADMEELIEYD